MQRAPSVTSYSPESVSGRYADFPS
jgi:hypothetical protein